MSTGGDGARAFPAQFVGRFFQILRERLKGYLPIGKGSALPLDPLEQARKTGFQALGNLFDVHQRDIPHTALDTAVVGPVKAATLRRLFLIDLLFLADATNCTTKPDANIERHWL